VKSWTFDELYGRDGQFLDGLDERSEAFVGEVPPNFHVWLAQPIVLRKRPKNPEKTGRRAKYPRLARRTAPPCEVQNLARYSPGFREQKAQRYRIYERPLVNRWSEIGKPCRDCWASRPEAFESLMTRRLTGSSRSSIYSGSSRGTSP
jgi:hypothetical protein